MDKLQLIGVLLSLALMAGGLYLAHRLMQAGIYEALIKLVGFAFCGLFLLLICDKIIAMRIDILTEKQSDEIFHYIVNMMWAVVGAYLNNKFSNTKN